MVMEAMAAASLGSDTHRSGGRPKVRAWCCGAQVGPLFVRRGLKHNFWPPSPSAYPRSSTACVRAACERQTWPPRLARALSAATGKQRRTAWLSARCASGLASQRALGGAAGRSPSALSLPAHELACSIVVTPLARKTRLLLTLTLSARALTGDRAATQLAQLVRVWAGVLRQQ